MGARGAYCTGQDIPLYQNTNGSWEIIPAVGGIGRRRCDR